MAASRQIKAIMLLWGAALLLSTTTPGLSAEILTGADAWRQIVGNTIVATTRLGYIADYFEPGGTIRHRDADGVTKGTWSDQNGTICFDYPDDDDRVCGSIEVSGTSGRFTDTGGAVESFEILPGNPNGL